MIFEGRREVNGVNRSLKLNSTLRCKYGKCIVELAKSTDRDIVPMEVLRPVRYDFVTLVEETAVVAECLQEKWLDMVRIDLGMITYSWAFWAVAYSPDRCAPYCTIFASPALTLPK
jgi:hypothetical protein